MRPSVPNIGPDGTPAIKDTLPTAAMLDTAIRMLHCKAPRGNIPVEGTSMLPVLRPGMLLHVDFAPGEPRRGDLLLFRQGDNLVVHRVVGRTRDVLKTRGDGRPTLDPPVARADVLGRVDLIGDEDGWRDLRGGLARIYARCLGLHNLAWSRLGAVARRLDGLAGKLGGGAWCRRAVWLLDSRLARLAHRTMFRLIHRRAEEPLSGSRETGTTA